MGITPLDIQKKKFGKSFRGFDEAEVESFLEEVAKYCTGLIRDNHSMKDRIRDIELKVANFQDREKTVNETLTVVRKVSDDMKENAKRQGEMIVSKAKARAREIFLKLQDEIKNLKMEAENYRLKREEIKGSLLQFLKNQISLLESSGVGEVISSDDDYPGLKSKREESLNINSESEFTPAKIENIDKAGERIVQTVNPEIPIELRLNRDFSPYERNSEAPKLDC